MSEEAPEPEYEGYDLSDRPQMTDDRARYELLLEEHGRQAQNHAREVTDLKVQHLMEIQDLQRKITDLDALVKTSVKKKE